ncbi:choice-of-anchor K domain-containing protein [Nitrosospira sp. NRS527]|uniref:choice-of-anchor K domain-containing protein n=1 Tax=Nitrosospira sp. NRS527 TaxID=155925 RepID=UPI001AF78E7F|nr:choice-of-anchor K domain-containing protein [Nitrosospira sp. NRS527]BCT67831.1 hypothetical protein NNRS527_01419 [Nitrosospira sp. NRS527]
MNLKLDKSHRCKSMWLSLIIVVALAPAYGHATDAGTSVGIFLDPTPSCPPATCSGVEMNSFNWGEPTSDLLGSQGNLTFVGDSFSPSAGETFKLGTLTYHNGATISGTDVTGIGLDIPLNFDDTSRNFTYHTSLSINNTLNISNPNIGTPEANADIVSFVGNTFPYTFHVLEGATASVDLMVKLTPTEDQLQLVGLTNPTTGGSVSIVPIMDPGRELRW